MAPALSIFLLQGQRGGGTCNHSACLAAPQQFMEIASTALSLIVEILADSQGTALRCFSYNSAHGRLLLTGQQG